MYNTRQDFSRAITAAREELDRVQVVAAKLKDFDQGFASRVLDLARRWNAFEITAKQAARTLTDWEQHKDKLDLFTREIGVYKTTAAKKIQEMEAASPPPAPAPAPATKTRPRRPRRAAAPPQEPALIPLPPAPKPTKALPSAVPRSIKQNIGPIAAGVAVGAVVLFALLKGKRR
jgi:hypothetical protein